MLRGGVAAVLGGVVGVQTQANEVQKVSQTDALLTRIDEVLSNNKRIETLYLVCTTGLFLAGMGCLGAAAYSGQFAWATPSVVTTWLLRWPLNNIQQIRRDNIALATAPAIIQMLPRDKAAEELQKLIQKLYGNSSP